ncbi:MAG TPA: hypothetical protein VLF71_03335, partial [Candidatus Saccharimonadales bacterium]|nr:hypothetical protein [Candidatus Saccharimonadales bacterium]
MRRQPSPQPSALRQWAVRLAPWAAIALYVGIAAYRIRFPGTEYDEALYVNAARGGVDNVTFMTKTFYGFPVLLMPYIGALKAYIFYP